MHVLVVISGVLPYPKASSGNPVVTWAVVKSLLDRGHNVSVCTFYRWRYDLYRDEARAFLENLGIVVYDLDEQLPPRFRKKTESRFVRYATEFRRAFMPRVSDHFPQVSVAPLLAQVIAAKRPDAMYVYDFPAAAVVAQLHNIPPRLTALVNLNHLHNSLRRRPINTKNWRSWMDNMLFAFSDRALAQIELQIICSSERVVEHAAHHAEWLRERGILQCFYLPNPVVDHIGNLWKKKREHYQAKEHKPIILFIGRLDSIINQPALDLLALEILPELERNLGLDGFYLDIVGTGDLLPAVSEKLDHPAVRIRGFVEDVQEEFLKSDVLLVPTPDQLGFRTRVAEGFSYGCCVVSHVSNALGMPELIHEENALLAGSGVSLAQQVVRALRDPDLRHSLGWRARDTYETKLDATKVCERIVSEMEQMKKL